MTYQMCQQTKFTDFHGHTGIQYRWEFQGPVPILSTFKGLDNKN